MDSFNVAAAQYYGTSSPVGYLLIEPRPWPIPGGSARFALELRPGLLQVVADRE
jgi:hypothetical protein